jgi:hypothetical protein
MYTEELPEEYAAETEAGPLMHIANKYQIQSLVQLIEEELIDRFVSELSKKPCIHFFV